MLYVRYSINVVVKTCYDVNGSKLLELWLEEYVCVCVCVCVFRTGLLFYRQKYFSCCFIDKILISTLGEDFFFFYEKKYFTC